MAAQEPAPAPVTAASDPQASAPLKVAPLDPDLQRGLDLLQAGQPRDAIGAFETSYARDQNPTALLSIGVAYTTLERPQAAIRALESYVEHADPQRDAAQIESAKQEIERLRSTSGHIGLHLAPETATVELDGEPADLRDGELLVAPGKHKLAAQADGYKPFVETIDVPVGKFTLEVQLLRVETAPVLVAAVAPAKTAAPLREATDEPEASDERGCALSQVCVGPVVALLGPPNLIGGGIHARIGRYLGIGVDYQVLPKVTLSPISVTTSLVSANARVYPFGGAFFLSGGIGYQSMRADIKEGDISLGAKSGVPAGMASIGFMGHDGFVLGADLGVLFPFNPMRATLSANTSVLTQNGISQTDINDARDKAERRVNDVLGAVPVLFQVNMIRLGYLF